MKKILSFALAAALTVALSAPALAWESHFGDVPSNHWAAEAINRANDDGAMVGTGTFPETGLARFEPDADLTSAQFAVIVAGEFYRDIPDGVAGPWYAPFRQAMEDAGWDEGAGIQDWEAPMTRYQMAVVLYNIAEEQRVPLPDREGLEAARDRISDWTQIPEEYRQAVAVNYALGLLSGADESGAFAGDQSLTRAQAAVVYGKLKDALFASGGPMEQVLSERERQLAEAGLTYEFTRYPGKMGTVYVEYQFGTSHGTACVMGYVDAEGRILDIGDLLPRYFTYGANYLSPSEITFSEDGTRLTFITPIKEGKGGYGEPEEIKDWGDTLCTVDLTAGTIVSMEPVGEK